MAEPYFHPYPGYWGADLMTIPDTTLVGYTWEVLAAFEQGRLQPSALVDYDGQMQTDMRACLVRYRTAGRDIVRELGRLLSGMFVGSLPEWTQELLFALGLEAYNPHKADGWDDVAAPPEVVARAPFDFRPD